MESAENKSRIDHFKIDAVHGSNGLHSIVTIVDRKSKYTIIGKLDAHTKEELNRKTIELIKREVNQVKTITADNGAKFYFATPTTLGNVAYMKIAMV